MVKIIAAVAAELVERSREAQSKKIFVGVYRYFLILGTDQISLACRILHGIHGWLRALFVNVVR